MKPFHVITLSFALFFLVEAAGAQLEEHQCADYRGTFGGSDFGDHSNIGMTLFVEGRSIAGTYFDKGDLRDFPLEGSYESDREITLTNLDSTGKPNGTFKLRFVESDPSRKADRPLTSDGLIGTIPHNMFANSQGIMIADGAFWFNEHGKAMAFNNPQ